MSQDLCKTDKTLILRWNQTCFKILFHIGIHASRWSNQLFQWALMCIHVQYACIKLETNFQTKLNISAPSVSKNNAEMSFEVNIYDCNLYLWQRFQYLTERDKHVGPNISRKYSGEIFEENMQERGHFLKTKICGRFQGWNSGGGDITTYLSCFCPLHILYKLCTLLF